MVGFDMEQGLTAMPAEKIARPVNRNHRAFCLAVARGMTQSQAYQRYVSRVTAKPWVQGCLLASRYRPYLAALRAKFALQADHAGVMSKLEIAQYLSRAARTPIAEIDENSDLCQEKTTFRCWRDCQTKDRQQVGCP